MNNEKKGEVVDSEYSDEMHNILEAIGKYIMKHGDDAFFIGVIGSYKEGLGCDIVDDRVFAYGDKKTLDMCMNELKDRLKKEKDFVNW